MKKIVVIGCIMSLLTSSCHRAYFTAADKDHADKVASWQIRNFSDTANPSLGWVHGALYRGMVDWADATGSESIYSFLMDVGASHQWGLLSRVYDGDDLCVAQTYLRLYDKYKREEMVRKVQERVDYIIAHPDRSPLINAAGKYYRGRWGWCDALFMAPPVYAQLYQKTGDKKYLDFCFQEYKVTTDSLYDRQERLFFRDLSLVKDRDSKGRKVFWGRGNGWVYGGLALLLGSVPESHESYAYYRNLYLEMTEAIVRCQDRQGSWHSSLHDAETYAQPENSCSGFFVYGLAFGLNKGLLDNVRYKTAVLKGWKALQGYVAENGKLEYVQPIGHDPLLLVADMTAPYGAGAYLLAATEMRKMQDGKR